MATYPVYPATTFTQAVELTIFASNQLHDVINGDALTTVETENGDIPTLRKALVDNFYFKTPITWVEGESSTVFNQLYYFDGTIATSGWYYAPQATLDNPIAMGSTPLGDDNWRLYQTAKESIPAQVYPWYTEITETVTSVSPPYEFDTAIVILNGVVLTPTKDYTISDNKINFTLSITPETDAETPDILFCYIGKVEEGNAATNYVTYNSLLSAGGASIIGTSSGQTLQQLIDAGASAVSLIQGGTLQDAIWYKTPEMFGASGNGTDDDSDFIQEALDWLVASNHRKLIFSSGKKYRTTKPLLADFGGSIIGSCIEMLGALYPDPDVGDALTISNSTYSQFILNVVGDGVTNASSLPNYNSADPSGAQQAFVINSCRAIKLSVVGYGYAGRVMRTKHTGTTKLSFLNIDIRTGESSCGQAMYLQGADSAFGVITSAQTQWDIYGSVLDSLTDVSIQYWEYGASSVNAFNPALTLTNLSSAHIDVLAGGQGSGNGTTLKIDAGVAITINKLFTTQSNIGLHIVGGTAGSSELNKQLTIGSHYSYGSNSLALKIENAWNIEIKDCHYDSVGNYGVYFAGTCRDVRINGYIRNPTVSCIYAESGANLHRVFFSGRLYSASAKNLVDLSLGTLQYLLFRDVTALSTGGRVMDLPATNGVVIDGGTWETTGSVLWQNRPSKIVNTYKPIVEARGSSNFPSGSASGATVVINHGLGVIPTDIDLRWVQIPSLGAQLVLTNTTDTTFTVTLVAETALAAQVNFRWFANSNLV